MRVGLPTIIADAESGLLVTPASAARLALAPGRPCHCLVRNRAISGMRLYAKGCTTQLFHLDSCLAKSTLTRRKALDERSASMDCLGVWITGHFPWHPALASSADSGKMLRSSASAVVPDTGGRLVHPGGGGPGQGRSVTVPTSLEQTEPQRGAGLSPRKDSHRIGGAAR